MAVDKGMMDKLDQSRQTDTLGSKAALDVNEMLLPATSPSLCLVLSHHSQLPSRLSPDLQEAFHGSVMGPTFPTNCQCRNLGSAGLFLCFPIWRLLFGN